VSGFSKLDVMFGRMAPDQVLHPSGGIQKPRVRFLQSRIEAIDPVSRTVRADAGELSGDVPVVALGADLDPAAMPGRIALQLTPPPVAGRLTSRRNRPNTNGTVCFTCRCRQERGC
jgi:NADPH-dependent 2,4-dienoyl-CoA reductase/sulfur reductase-like enzyme